MCNLSRKQQHKILHVQYLDSEFLEQLNANWRSFDVPSRKCERFLSCFTKRQSSLCNAVGVPTHRSSTWCHAWPWGGGPVNVAPLVGHRGRAGGQATYWTTVHHKAEHTRHTSSQDESSLDLLEHPEDTRHENETIRWINWCVSR